MYKAFTVGYHPKAKDMAAAVERMANEIAEQGFRVVSMSITGSGKAIILAQSSSLAETASTADIDGVSASDAEENAQ